MRSTTITLTILVTLLLLAARPPAEAQQVGKTPIIGYLSAAAARTPVDEAFEQSLQELGWVKDRNIRIERRHPPGGRREALPSLAAELVQLRADVLVAWSSAGALAAKRATSHLPVVFLAVGDPVEFGLVSSLARPGGNLTGLSFDAALETYPKGLELLREAIPALTRVTLLLSASDPRLAGVRRTMMTGARELKLELDEVLVETPAELEAGVRKAKDQGAQALYVWPSGFSFSFGKQLSEFALANRLPSIHSFRESAVAGGLLSYAPSLTDIARRGAVYVDKILRGARPSDLPVEQPTKFELVINLKTAKTLGLKLPQSLLLRADEIIQ